MVVDLNPPAHVSDVHQLFPCRPTNLQSSSWIVLEGNHLLAITTQQYDDVQENDRPKVFNSGHRVCVAGGAVFGSTPAQRTKRLRPTTPGAHLHDCRRTTTR